MSNQAGFTSLSVNDAHRYLRAGTISGETFERVMYYSDKLNFRESAWQAQYHKEHGFVALVDKINEYRAEVGLAPIESPYIDQCRAELAARVSA